MARGKVKYRDVVGGRKQKSHPKPKSNKPRKTFTLYKVDHHNKSKFKSKKLGPSIRPHEIKAVSDEKVPNSVRDESDVSANEEEFDDPMKQLRESFKSHVNKESLAIDSSDDSSDEGSHSEQENVNLDVEMDELEHKECNNLEEEQILEEVENAEDADENISDDDPFTKHFAFDLDETLIELLKNNSSASNQVINWPVLGTLIIQILDYKDSQEEMTEFSIEERKKVAKKGTVPVVYDLKQGMRHLCIKSQIIPHLRKANALLDDQGSNSVFTPLQSELFSIMNNYQDLYFPQRDFKNANELRFIYCLHAVNHVLKTRLKVIHHNARLVNKDDVPDEFRDQGLVRPKVLIVVPFKDSAFKIIQVIIAILLTDGNKGSVMNKKRFMEEFTGNELVMPKKNAKPEDYERTFTGNVSDNFKIGLSVTKKSLRLYADFYSSDIIVASPLGLRTILGAEGEPERNYDFLSSIELLILDQTDIFTMQNWDHLLHIFNHLHLQPKESHGTDFSRVRTWCLNGLAKYYRQTLIFSSMLLPEINAIFNKKCSNFAGKIKVANAVDRGVISQVFVQLPHVFHKFSCANVQEVSDARFEFFVEKILPQQRDSLMKQTLVYVANYFDYVRLRNYLNKEEIPFVQVCEYSKDAKVARARDMFFHGDAHFMLYTERHHFFNRLRVKGIRHLVFYQPPTFSHFYYEMCNLMQQANMNKKIGNVSNMSVNVLYSKYDVYQLSAIVGTEKASKMLQSERNVHMMVTGTD